MNDESTITASTRGNDFFHDVVATLMVDVDDVLVLFVYFFRDENSGDAIEKIRYGIHIDVNRLMC